MRLANEEVLLEGEGAERIVAFPHEVPRPRRGPGGRPT
jgi:hypothetical protein